MAKARRIDARPERGNVLIGTASRADPSLIECGSFYPSDVKSPEARLRFYASQFPLVEVDSPYYAIPSAKTAKQWAERTPDDFVFDVKAFRALTTHQTQPRVLPRYIAESLPERAKKTVYYKDLPNELRDALWSEFKNALVPLKQAGKLGVILFQFPPWFTPSPGNRAHLEECVERMKGYLLAVEFRNRTWFGERGTPKTLALLRDLNAAHVIVDEPQGFSSSVPAVWDVTASIAVLRLHGRNHGTWEKKGLKAASERFDYYYTKEEVGELVEPIKSISAQAESVHVVVNTNRADQGPANARLLKSMLQQ
jgi:uncharacterized protein YecE (DUF72 family)